MSGRDARRKDYLTRYFEAKEKLGWIPDSPLCMPELSQYFDMETERLFLCIHVLDLVLAGEIENLSYDELLGINKRLFAPYESDTYASSPANPAYAAERFGSECGKIISFLCSEAESAISAAYMGELSELTEYLELFIGVHDCFLSEPRTAAKRARQFIKKYFYNCCGLYAEKQVREMLVPGGRASELALRRDPCDRRVVLLYGRPVGDNEIRISKYLAKLPKKTIQMMADTFTEGYRIGFSATGKDLTKKKTVQLHFCIGFERVAQAAAKNLMKMGLEPTISIQPTSSFFSKNGGQRNVYATHQNAQYDFDHRQDRALFISKRFIDHRIETLGRAFREHAAEALVHAGPAVQEIFGESSFFPETCADAVKLTSAQQKLSVYENSRLIDTIYSFIPADERSFTIIAYPVPAIGKNFKKIFSETIRINTLDYKKYRRMQQAMIDAMDGAHHVRVLGRGENKTDMTVRLARPRDPLRETAFENCVADVNIPVGEVFTTPVLEGTHGTLHVSEVYLNGLKFRDLMIKFSDGMVTEYTCGNFGDEAENKKYIRDNILMNHDTLPIGEFAIGTNTTAYACARKYGIAGKLPILIAEKTGPHFAVGDTCYSREEDVKTYNPDGKEIIAKENTFSRKRGESPSEAYFGCHTDITIPFEELGLIEAVGTDGKKTDIIRDSSFVLAGTEELNVPLKEILSD